MARTHYEGNVIRNINTLHQRKDYLKQRGMPNVITWSSVKEREERDKSQKEITANELFIIPERTDERERETKVRRINRPSEKGSE